MSLISRALGRPSKRRMDPSWVEHIAQQYDVDAGYTAYHAYCREHSSAVAEASPAREIGYEHLRATSAEVAGEIEHEVLARFETRPTVEKSQHLSLFEIDDPGFERSMLERILTPACDEAIARYFGSDYFVYWYHVSRSVPVPELGLNSFRWHCDRGPQAHLKLLFYLNGWNEHGGGTAFLDLDTTQKIARSGYVFAPVKTRLTDLGAIARRHGATYAPWFPEMKAGEGVLFPPSSVLHRGMISTKGPRHVVTICLLPSPVPWSEAYARGVRSQSRSDGKWPEHAAHFRDALAKNAG